MVGAGLSFPAGLPGFEGLLRGVIASEQIELDIAEGGSYDDLDRIQFQVAEEVSKEKMCSIMRNMLILDPPFPVAVQPNLQAFNMLPFVAVVSWNWDNLLDAQYL